jgi:3-dehydroquinate synthetase
LLNYGHTLAHALEIETNHALAHGEAVGIGLVYAAHLAHHLGRISAERVQQHYEVVGGAYELDTALPDGLSPTRLVALMARDKKVLGDQLTFVLDGTAGRADVWWPVCAASRQRWSRPREHALTAMTPRDPHRTTAPARVARGRQAALLAAQR